MRLLPPAASALGLAALLALASVPASAQGVAPEAAAPESPTAQRARQVAPPAPGTGAAIEATDDEKAAAAIRATQEAQQRDAQGGGGPVSRSSPASPAAGAPEAQAPVPEVGAGRGAANSQVPESTVRGDAPTGGTATPAELQAVAPRAAPTPVQNQPPPAAYTSQGPNARDLELQAALRGDAIVGRITHPDSSLAVLVQPEGRAFRETRNTTVYWIGAVATLGVLALLALFYLARGRIRPEHGMSGRTIRRFGWFERGTHWLVSGSFVVLALTGLNLVFGRYTILPLLGPEAFATASQWGKTAHNFLGIPFTVGIVLMFAMWVRDNIPERLDLAWIKAGGGFIGKGHPPARRFNFGQKVIFWVTIVGGTALSVTGFLLMFPLWGNLDVSDMQTAQIVHGLISVLMVAAILAHIYIGSVGMEGAIQAMTNGRVDYNWAREHHSLWVEEELAKARTAVGPPDPPVLGPGDTGMRRAVAGTAD